jgi:hypothetical protein
MRQINRSESGTEVPAGQYQEIEPQARRPAGPGIPLRVGTLSWSLSKRSRHPLTAEQFLATLEQVHIKAPEPSDLLLASGRTLSDEPVPEEVLARTIGPAVVYEVINPGRTTARWVLAHGGTEARAHRVRTEQILVRGDDEPSFYDRLSAELLAGGGVIPIGGSDTKFVLLICGENNALNTSRRNRSVLRHPCPGLASCLGGRWIALNPAHDPYWPQSKMKGFAKVGRVGGVGETMARTVAVRGPYADGTRPPVAFVHANNFYADEPRTRAYASVAFDAKGRMTPIRTEQGSVSVNDGRSLDWIFSGYEILA